MLPEAVNVMLRLDMDYLNIWADELKVADLLQRALKESE